MKASPYRLFHYKYALETLNSFEAKDLNFFRPFSPFPLLVFVTNRVPDWNKRYLSTMQAFLEVSL